MSVMHWQDVVRASDPVGASGASDATGGVTGSNERKPGSPATMHARLKPKFAR
jgi:hypothetical protein